MSKTENLPGLGKTPFPEGTRELFAAFYDNLQAIGLTHKQVKNIGFGLMIAAHVLIEVERDKEQMVADGVGGTRNS